MLQSEFEKNQLGVTGRGARRSPFNSESSATHRIAFIASYNFR